MADDERNLPVEIDEKTKKKISDMTSLVKDISKDLGIDLDEIRKEKDRMMFPALTDDLMDDTKQILIQTHGLFAFSNMQMDQDDIPYFKPYECKCEEATITTEHAYWIHMGNRKYLRVICPSCKSKTVPEDISLNKCSQLSEKEPSIALVMEKMEILPNPERVVDIETETIEHEED